MGEIGCFLSHYLIWEEVRSLMVYSSRLHSRDFFPHVLVYKSVWKTMYSLWTLLQSFDFPLLFLDG